MMWIPRPYFSARNLKLKLKKNIMFVIFKILDVAMEFLQNDSFRQVTFKKKKILNVMYNCFFFFPETS